MSRRLADVALLTALRTAVAFVVRFVLRGGR